MFQNRLAKVYKHFGKIARKQEIACYRFYDHDLPEFPFAIDWYNGAVHAAEYKRRHGMEDEEHEAWLQACRETIAGVLEIDASNIYMKVRQRKAGAWCAARQKTLMCSIYSAIRGLSVSMQHMVVPVLLHL
jgi:23S rRNA (cytosine1962-C5)-methyltransferase